MHRLMRWTSFGPLLRPGAKKGTIAVFLLAVAFALPGCSGGGGGDAPKGEAPKAEGAAPSARLAAGDPDAGKVVYERYCHYCHGREGRGDGRVTMAISPRPPDFVEDTERMSRSDEELLKSITYGIARKAGGEQLVMPRWKEILSEKERRDVLAYIRRLVAEGREKARTGAEGAGPGKAKTE